MYIYNTSSLEKLTISMHQIWYSILVRHENININNIINLIQTRITLNKKNCFDSFLELIEFKHSDTPI